MPNWEPQKYGSGSTLTLAPGMELETWLPITNRGDASPDWRCAAFDVKQANGFVTEQAAKARAVRLAEMLLRDAAINLERYKQEAGEQ